MGKMHPNTRKSIDDANARLMHEAERFIRASWSCQFDEVDVHLVDFSGDFGSLVVPFKDGKKARKFSQSIRLAIRKDYGTDAKAVAKTAGKQWVKTYRKDIPSHISFFGAVTGWGGLVHLRLKRIKLMSPGNISRRKD